MGAALPPPAQLEHRTKTQLQGPFLRADPRMATTSHTARSSLQNMAQPSAKQMRGPFPAREAAYLHPDEWGRGGGASGGQSGNSVHLHNTWGKYHNAAFPWLIGGASELPGMKLLSGLGKNPSTQRHNHRICSSNDAFSTQSTLVLPPANPMLKPKRRNQSMQWTGEIETRRLLHLH